jgi:hypothetical protein
MGRLFTIAVVLKFVLSSYCFAQQNYIGYTLEKPDATWILPDTLREISGVTLIDSSTIACVQDENGIIFLYDLKSKKIKQQFTFSGNGDYECVVKVKQLLFVLRSDGMIYEISDFLSDKRVVKNYATGIPSSNNEGLCYDEKNNRLLISCKSDARGKDLMNKRAIYAFDLVTKKLMKEPAYLFDVTEVALFCASRGLELPVHYSRRGKPKKIQLKFRPSALCLHPQSKQLFILSAVDHLLLVVDPATGKLSEATALNSVIFNKPEGVCFYADGTMIISNEAQDKKASLLKFRYNK